MSLPSSVQDSLFDALPSAPRPFTRRELAEGAWVDVCPGWLAGADDVFCRLVREVPWREDRRKMYEKVVDVPRLVYTYHAGEPLPHPSLATARDSLSAHYADVLPDGFATAGLCLYRDGRDSVAWHGDRIGRARDEDTLIAIVSLGDTRLLKLRPRGGGQALSFRLGHGDLLVMGGSCQRTWDHAVPKVPSADVRLSIQFRPLHVW